MSTGVLHVVAAAIGDGRGAYLISRRADTAHQGGKWEFPGGKVEAGESAQEALARELDEELGIRPLEYRPLIRVRHDYPDKSVLLDVWRVARFAGRPEGREGQPLAWVAVKALSKYEFPEANRPIIDALNLPARYLVTPEPGARHDAFLARLEQVLSCGIELVQLRANTLDPDAYAGLAREVLALCRAGDAALLLNADPALAETLGADGVHLNAARLLALKERPLPRAYRIAASCHDARELAQARRIGADFAVLSPVKPTRSHPGAQPLGWTAFSGLCETAALPVYALGGLGPEDLNDAWNAGAQGIAAIRGLWETA